MTGHIWITPEDEWLLWLPCINYLISAICALQSAPVRPNICTFTRSMKITLITFFTLIINGPSSMKKPHLCIHYLRPKIARIHPEELKVMKLQVYPDSSISLGRSIISRFMKWTAGLSGLTPVRRWSNSLAVRRQATSSFSTQTVRCYPQTR